MSMFDKLKGLIGKPQEKSQLQQYDEALNQAADEASKDLNPSDLLLRNQESSYISPIESVINDPKAREHVYLKRLRDKSNVFPLDIANKLSEKLIDLKDSALNANDKFNPDLKEEAIKRQYEMGKKVFKTNPKLKLEGKDEAYFVENGQAYPYHGYMDQKNNTIRVNKDNAEKNTVFHEMMHTLYEPKAAEDVNTYIPRDNNLADNISFLQNEHIDNKEQVRKDTGLNISLGENYELFRAIKEAIKNNSNKN